MDANTSKSTRVSKSIWSRYHSSVTLHPINSVSTEFYFLSITPLKSLLSANHGKRQFSTKDCRFSFVLKAVRKTVDLFPITWYNIIDEFRDEQNAKK